MRILGTRSLMSFLKLNVDIAFWGVVAVAGLMLVAVVPLTLLAPAGLSLDVPARFDLDPSTYEITARAGDGERTVTIQDARGDVVIKGVDRWQAAQGFAAGILALAVTFIVLLQLRGIFRTLREGRPFAQANVQRMRVLGLTVAAGEVLRAAMVSWTSLRLGREFVSRGIEFRGSFEPSLSIVFAGLLLLVLAEVFREAAFMKRDLETAREIQFRLVPAAEFRHGPVAVRSHMQPANTVGGDYYDVLSLAEGKVAVVQADVAGKGIPAALLMATLQGSLRTLLSAGLRGRALVDALNRYLCENTPANRMVTLFYGELDETSGEMEYVNAGHNPPFVLRRDGTLERPGDASLVLGIVPDKTYATSRLRLEPGERLLLVTDGVSEARRQDGAEYGDERLAGYLRRFPPGRTDRELVEGLVREVLGFCRPAAPFDDMTVTLVRRG